MADPPLWDDTYEGPRFTYGLTFRPVGFGNVPKGYILKSDRPHPDFRHGSIQYPRKLSERVAEQAELTLIEETPAP